MSAGDIAEVVTATIATLAFGAAIWQVRSSKQIAAETLRQTERHNRQQTTHQYVFRLSDAEFMKRLAHSKRVLTPPKGAKGHDKCWRAYKALSLQEQFDVAAPLNSFEEIAGLYNLGHLDRAIVERQLGYIARVAFEQFHWWIVRVREQAPLSLCEWEQMVHDLNTFDASAE